VNFQTVVTTFLKIEKAFEEETSKSIICAMCPF